jgi:uncharacterized membrane protein
MWPSVLISSAACYLLKLTGLLIPQHLLERPMLKKAVELLPVGMLAALIAAQTLTYGTHLTVDARLAGAASAVVAVRFKAPFLVTVALGAAVTAAIRLWVPAA